MKTIITYKGTTMTKKAASNFFGKELIERRIKEAKELYKEDPLVLCGWSDGMEIIIKI